MVVSKRIIMLLAVGLFAVVGLSQIVWRITPKRAPAAAHQAVFAAPEVINRRLGRRSQPAPRRPEERLLHHRNNPARSRLSPAGSCAAWARQSWADSLARCFSQGSRMPVVSGDLAAADSA